MHWLDIYHLAHWCRECKQEFSHSQGDWDTLRCYHQGHSLVTCETKRLSKDDAKRTRQWFAIARNVQGHTI